MRLRGALLILLMITAFVALVSTSEMPQIVNAQNATSAATTSSISTPAIPADQLSITWPVPVTELWDKQDIQGTVDIPNLDHYLLEWQPLNQDLSMPTNAPWTPASAAQTKPVRNGVIATLDTTGIPDSVY